MPRYDDPHANVGRSDWSSGSGSWSRADDDSERPVTTVTVMEGGTGEDHAREVDVPEEGVRVDLDALVCFLYSDDAMIYEAEHPDHGGDLAFRAPPRERVPACNLEWVRLLPAEYQDGVEEVEEDEPEGTPSTYDNLLTNAM